MASRVDWSLDIQLWIAKKFRLDFPKTDVRDQLESIAYSKEHANLARDYMLNCQQHAGSDDERDSNFWGSGRKGPGPAFYSLCYDVLDLQNANLHPHYDEEIQKAYEGFLWFWLQGVAARACVPGCKMEIVLNIFGSQGIGKSLFFRDLCPDPAWFTDSIQDSIVGSGQNNRDELMKMHAKIIIEMPELNPMKRGGKSADDKLKQFLSSQFDTMRLPYGHDSVDYPRTCAFGGTSNNRDIYRDPTGARRFVSIDHGKIGIRVGDLDKGVMDSIRDRLWGEVVSSFNYGELYSSPNKLIVSIPPQLRGMQNKSNNHHRYEEIGMDEILEWMDTKTRITWEEVLAFAKTIAGLGDEKSSILRHRIKAELTRHEHWEYKRSQSRIDKDGKKRRTNLWINLNHSLEKNRENWHEAPDHWSTYDNEEIETEY